MTVAGLASCAAVLAGWYSIPDPPVLEGRRWFRTVLANLLLGEVEREGGDGDAWQSRFEALVPADGWHEEARYSVLDDPAELGVVYNPATWLGGTDGWQRLAAWTELEPVVDASLAAHWLIVRGATLAHPELVNALLAQLGDRATVVPGAEGTAEQLADTVAELALTIHQGGVDQDRRIVLVGEGKGAALATRAMARHAGLRDVVPAVLAIGGALDEVAEWFGHDTLDTERVGITPWFSLSWADAPLDKQRFPEPGGEAGELWGVRPVDLGAVQPGRDSAAVARAIRVVLTCWVLSQARS